jgi:hypothetical protein
MKMLFTSDINTDDLRCVALFNVLFYTQQKTHAVAQRRNDADNGTSAGIKIICIMNQEMKLINFRLLLL